MKRKLLIAIITVITFTACNTETKRKEPIKIENTEQVEKNDGIEKAFTKFKSFYAELIRFKNDADFKKLGFGKNSEYSKWFEKVNKFKKNPDSKFLIKKGVLIEELEQLGIAYVVSEGKETEVTKVFNKIFSDAISYKPIQDKKPTSSGNINYDRLKSDYELFGKWTIANTIVKQSYPYEIYKKENEYVGIKLNNFKIEGLSKKGTDYYVNGNKHGEFYRIDKNLKMVLFDKDGDLTNTGYKATKTAKI
jgi:hypothetical protein